MKQTFFTLILAAFATFIWGQDIEVPQVKRAIITKHTATWCTNCGRTAWDVFEQVVEELNTNSIALAAHRSGSSQLYSQAAKDFLDNMQGVVYQPEFFVNETKMSGSSSTLYDNIKDEVFAIENEVPEAQMGLELFVNEDGTGPLLIKTRTKFFKELSGAYYLSLWMIEKEVVEFQQSQGDNAVHKQVLRKALTSETFGDELFNGNVSPDNDIYQDFEYEFEEGETMENMEIMVALWKLVDGRYEYVNSNAADQVFVRSEPTAVNELEQQVADFQVNPSILSETAQIKFNLGEKMEQLSLNVYNPAGQLIQTLFKGNLQSGLHQFELQKADLPSQGLYILSLQSPKGIVSKRLVRN